MKNLILWRHAEAEVNSISGADSDRALTKRGYKDAAKMAKWLNKHLPPNTQVFCSPARRCLETVAALQKIKSIQLEVSDFLSIETTPEIITNKISEENSSNTILIVGHQPNLGIVISKLLDINESVCPIKKGSVWWLQQRVKEEGMQTYLFAVQPPNF
jgi:phosphohistidine phosphatase